MFIVPLDCIKDVKTSVNFSFRGGKYADVLSNRHIITGFTQRNLDAIQVQVTEPAASEGVDGLDVEVSDKFRRIPMDYVSGDVAKIKGGDRLDSRIVIIITN